MKAILVGCDEEDFDLVELDLPAVTGTIEHLGKIYFCTGQEDGVVFYTNL